MNKIEVYYDESFYGIDYEPNAVLNLNLDNRCQHVSDTVLPHALRIHAGGDGFTVCLKCLQEGLQSMGILDLLQTKEQENSNET